jgi:hypothetical protein
MRKTSNGFEHLDFFEVSSSHFIHLSYAQKYGVHNAGKFLKFSVHYESVCIGVDNMTTSGNN